MPGASTTHATVRVTAVHRIGALAIACGCLLILVVASRLTPAAEGHGTHTQLRLPACGWAMLLGYPCPTCGMTTAVTLCARGRPVEAFTTQPAGALIALLLAVVFWVCVHVTFTGSTLGERLLGLLGPRSLWLIFGILAAAWAYKISVWPR